nr:anti-repressor SinI family protein [Lederbergia galactosidilytica]
MNLDDEWLSLILQAKKIGLKPDEVRTFLYNTIQLKKANVSNLEKANSKSP